MAVHKKEHLQQKIQEECAGFTCGMLDDSFDMAGTPIKPRTIAALAASDGILNHHNMTKQERNNCTGFTEKMFVSCL